MHTYKCICPMICTVGPSAKSWLQMRDYLLFYINGKEHRVKGEHAFLPLSSYLRYVEGATGTKVVCEEGDCGACSVLLGEVSGEEIAYKTVNSCIQYLYQVDTLHIVTIEGLKYAGELNPVQESMVNCHGTQCGFCTPGFVVAMCGMFDQKKCATAQEVKDCLTGNLCRCTGYVSIVESGIAVNGESIISLNELYPPDFIREALVQASTREARVTDGAKSVYIPATLQQALRYRLENPGAAIVNGGTDACVNMNKRDYEPENVLSFARLHELRSISVENGKLVVGGTATLAQLEQFANENVPELHELLWLFGSPQIRNAGTLAGNIANASPIADTPPFLFVMNAELELTSSSGTRTVHITNFYTAYKKFDLRTDEIISRIFIPLPRTGELLKLYKVSKRKHLDISSFTAAFRLSLGKDNLIDDIAVCYGGVGPIILRMYRTEEYLRGKPFVIETFQSAADIALSEITPITDVRGSKEFRNQLARNILLKFFHEVRESRRVPACL